eukprot:4885014-Pyramimonas_sp.AAC.1
MDETHRNILVQSILLGGARPTRARSAYPSCNTSRFPSGVARKRPPRRVNYDISRCARRPRGHDEHTVV